MPEPHQRWFWHPALKSSLSHVVTLHHSTATSQQATLSICQVAVFSTQQIHHVPPQLHKTAISPRCWWSAATAANTPPAWTTTPVAG